MDKPYGITYGKWTVKWWQWIYSTPRSISPLFDPDGKHWKKNQPLSDVWFLVGSLADIPKPLPHRKIKMKFGRSILFPVLNCEANLCEYPEFTHDELVKHVTVDVNSVLQKDCTINGNLISPVVVPSDPTIYKVRIAKDNAFKIEKTGLTDATAYGYWIFLKPIPKGIYEIRFEGSCESGRLHSGADYELEIF